MTPTRTRIRPSSERSAKARHVLAIHGEYVPDVVSQSELKKAHELCMASFQAARVAHAAARAIEARLAIGARIESGGYGWSRVAECVAAPGCIHFY